MLLKLSSLGPIYTKVFSRIYLQYATRQCILPTQGCLNIDLRPFRKFLLQWHHQDRIRQTSTDSGKSAEGCRVDEMIPCKIRRMLYMYTLTLRGEFFYVRHLLWLRKSVFNIMSKHPRHSHLLFVSGIVSCLLSLIRFQIVATRIRTPDLLHVSRTLYRTRPSLQPHPGLLCISAVWNNDYLSTNDRGDGAVGKSVGPASGRFNVRNPAATDLSRINR